MVMFKERGAKEIVLVVALLLVVSVFVGFFGTYMTGHAVSDTYRVDLAVDESEVVHGHVFELVTTAEHGDRDAAALLLVDNRHLYLYEGKSQRVGNVVVELTDVRHSYDRSSVYFGERAVTLHVSFSKIDEYVDRKGLGNLPAPFVVSERYDQFSILVADDAGEAVLEQAGVVARGFWTGSHMAPVEFVSERELTSYADNFIVLGLCDDAFISSRVDRCASLPEGTGYIYLTQDLRDGRPAKGSMDTYLYVVGADDAGLAKAADVLAHYDRYVLSGHYTVVSGDAPYALLSA